MKKTQRKLALILMVAIFTCFLVACGNSENESNGNNDNAGLKIAIVTSGTGVDDGSFNEENYNGILQFIKNNPTATVKSVREESGDPTASVQAVADIVADYDVIITPGFQFAGISTIALENPDKMFILVDSEPTPVGDQTEFENIYSMMFAEEESGFFAGIAAALETKTNKVAVVNGIAYPSNVNYQFGFESGVNYANKIFGTKAEIVELAGYSGTDVTGQNIGGNYAGSFGDEATGKVIGNALIEKGVDRIFVAAGATGNGVFTAVKEAKGDVLVIGCDVDQFNDGINGSTNIVLTSVVKFMSMNNEKVLNSIVDQTFKGGNVLLHADTESTGFIKEEGHQQLSQDTISKMNDTYELLKQGEIVPASNFNGHTPESFPGL